MNAEASALTRRPKVNRALTGRGPVTVIAPLAVVAVVIFALTTEGFATSGNFKSIAFSTAF
ncbi:MAG TPA: hypothetical protein VHA76_08190, partial [Solirubrobacterales bacterium]|nr:hypothetical protein [Solirubrobacterales bacterium]